MSFGPVSAMSSPPTVKICGLTTLETVEAAIAAGADMLGFVFFERSPRHCSLDLAAELGRSVGTRARTVALTVDADDGALDAIMAALDPDLLQLHGRETPARVAEIKARLDRPVIKAVGIAAAGDLTTAEAYLGVADWLLFDAKARPEALLPGGNGRAFDWEVLEGLDGMRPFMLSGGLDAANVAEAIRIARPSGVDVSSGVETRPGEKDPDRIRDFVVAARAAFDIALVESAAP
jgi:phosphoribosylanthranilate isomerase